MIYTIVFGTSDLIDSIDECNFDNVEKLMGQGEPFETIEIDTEGVYSSENVYVFMKAVATNGSYTTLTGEAEVKFNEIYENL